MAYLVGIDCGHGMYTDGKRTPKLKEDIKINGKVVKKKGEIIHENEWNRAVGKYLAKALNRCGIDTYYTSDMSGKTDTPLSTRASRANARKCDILVSCHYNAYGGCSKFLDKKGGLLVLRTKNCSSNSIKLGKLVVEQLYKDIDYKYNYGLCRDVDMSGFTLAILRQTNMPSILIEYGFMDVWNEAKKMVDPAHQKACAESTCKAICKYFGVTYKKEVVEKPKEEVKPVTKTIYYRVVTGSYTVRDNAVDEQNKLKKLGYDAFLVAVEIDKKTMFRVVAESYKDKKDAEALIVKLKKQGYDAFISIYEK